MGSIVDLHGLLRGQLSKPKGPDYSPILAQFPKTGKAPHRILSYKADAGLGNRLRAHFAAQLLALYSGRKVVPAWERSAAFGALHDEIIDFPAECLPYDSHAIIPFDGRFYGQVYPTIAESAASLAILAPEWQYIMPEHLFRGQSYYASAIRNNFRWQQRIVEEAAPLLGRWRRPVLGIHVRRGDFVPTHMNVSIARYVQALKIASASRQFGSIFIASDGTTDEIFEVARCVDVPAFFDLDGQCREGNTGSRKAAADLYLLSQADFLVLTPHSSFSEMAAFLGRMPTLLA